MCQHETTLLVHSPHELWILKINGIMPQRTAINDSEFHLRLLFTVLSKMIVLVSTHTWVYFCNLSIKNTMQYYFIVYIKIILQDDNCILHETNNSINCFHCNYIK